MLRKPLAVPALFSAALMATFASAADGPRLEPLRVNAAWEVGQIESFEKDAGGPVSGEDKQLLNHSAVWLLQEARLSENARVYVGVGGMYFFILPSTSNQYSLGQRSAFGLTDAHAEFDFLRGEGNDMGLRLKAGIIPYKYNEDAKNLGEYMYRTYTYPTVITGGGLVMLNSAGVQLNGIIAETRWGGLKNEVLLTAKTDQVPSAALSAADIVSYNVGNLLTVGGGFMFDNFYSADGIADGDASDPALAPQEYYWELADGRKVLYGGDTTGSTVVATKHFKFVGQKAMWRASVDLGNALGMAGLSSIASGSFKVYYEGVLMGLEDHPIFYENRKDRISHMVGVNVPTFGLLDVLSGEVEYCSNPYAPNLSYATLYLSPTPAGGTGYSSDDLKWSLYARKSILPGFAITAQAARDHIRLVDYFGHTNDFEVLPKRKNWYWAMQLSYSI